MDRCAVVWEVLLQSDSRIIILLTKTGGVFEAPDDSVSVDWRWWGGTELTIAASYFLAGRHCLGPGSGTDTLRVTTLCCGLNRNMKEK